MLDVTVQDALLFVIVGVGINDLFGIWIDSALEAWALSLVLFMIHVVQLV
jgi:hypothetical protein